MTPSKAANHAPDDGKVQHPAHSEKDSDTLTQLIAMLRQREQVGRTKYGTTVDRTDFTHVDWLREALHESMDKSLYLLRAIETAPNWQPADAIPDLQAGTDRYFQIAVKRLNGKVYSYPALYGNSLALSSEDTEPSGNSGNRWRWHFLPEHLADEGDMGVTGWYDAKSSSEYDSCYCPALDKDDELMGWHELPQYLHTEYSSVIGIANNGEVRS